MNYQKRLLTSAEFRRLQVRVELRGALVGVDLRDLIASDRERLLKSLGMEVGGREHFYRGGPPPARIKRMQLSHETRARKAGVHWDIIDLRDVYSHYSGICGICGTAVSLETFTIDHIIPIERGGPHLFDNLQPAHKSCNSSKGASLDYAKADYL